MEECVVCNCLEFYQDFEVEELPFVETSGMAINQTH